MVEVDNPGFVDSGCAPHMHSAALSMYYKFHPSINLFTYLHLPIIRQPDVDGRHTTCHWPPISPLPSAFCMLNNLRASNRHVEDVS